MRSWIWTSPPRSKRKRRARLSACRRETSASSMPRSSRNERPSSTDVLDLPFFDRGHAALAARLDAYARDQVAPHAERAERGDLIAAGRAFIGSAAAADVLEVFVGDGRSAPSLRQLCLARERIAAHSAFADSVLAVSGLGSYPIHLAGSDDLKASYAEPAGDGDAIGAFALTEPNAGSDPAGIETTARRDGDRYRISGAKTFIS